jgi:ribosomal protein S18 acetylase RimI-like enzyme
MLDLKPSLDRTDVRNLLALSVGQPTPQKIRAICERYRTDSRKRLFGIERDNDLVGCIGLEMTNENKATILNISVLSSCRRQGLGRTMIRESIALLSVSELSAETDAEAKDFYVQCGFEVKSLGEKYPGVERFHCTLQPFD